MAPAGTADGDRQMRLALGDVLGDQEVQQRPEPLVEGLELAVARHVLDDLRIEARQRPQLGFPVRVGQEAHVEHDVAVARQPVLVAERRQRHRELGAPLARQELVRDAAAQRGCRDPARVEHEIGAFPDVLQRVALGRDALGDRPRRAQRVAPAGLLVAPEQRVLVGVEEQHPVRDAARGEIVELRAEGHEQLARADVGDDGGATYLGALVDEDVDEAADHLGRQVVDAEVAVVLEDVHRRRLAGSGEAGDHDEILEARGGWRIVREGHVVDYAGRLGHPEVLFRYA